MSCNSTTGFLFCVYFCYSSPDICEAVFLSSVLKTERINADQQPGDCEQDIEKLNIRHTHHLRFCILLRRLHPVDLLAYEMIIACT